MWSQASCECTVPGCSHLHLQSVVVIISVMYPFPVGHREEQQQHILRLSQFELGFLESCSLHMGMNFEAYVLRIQNSTALILSLLGQKPHKVPDVTNTTLLEMCPSLTTSFSTVSPWVLQTFRIFSSISTHFRSTILPFLVDSFFVFICLVGFWRHVYNHC